MRIPRNEANDTPHKNKGVTSYLRGATGSFFEDALENDVVLPAQFFDRKRTDTPEKRLIAAVLEGALSEYNLHRLDFNELQGQAFKRWYDALNWLTDADTERIFSLRWCCQALSSRGFEIDPERIASYIRTRGPIGKLGRQLNIPYLLQSNNRGGHGKKRPEPIKTPARVAYTGTSRFSHKLKVY